MNLLKACNTGGYTVSSLYLLTFFCDHNCLFVLGEYYLFCKGADSSVFPRVVSGKVEQVRARVEHNAVVSRNRKHLHLLSYFSRAINRPQKHLSRSWYKKSSSQMCLLLQLLFSMSITLKESFLQKELLPSYVFSHRSPTMFSLAFLRGMSIINNCY